MRTSDSISALFEEYVRYLCQGNFLEQRLAGSADKFAKQIRRHEDSLFAPEDLEEVLRSCTAGKEGYKEVVLDFYDYYESRNGIHVESDLSEKEIIDDPRRRQVAILKYLQSHKCTTRKLADHFMVSEKTMNEDLRALETGVDIHGTTIRADVEHDGWKNFQENSQHPVMLNLTMTEVVALTVGLLDAAEKEPLYETALRSVAYKTYRNLTDYGKLRLKGILDNREIHDFDAEVEAFENELSNGLMTMWKSGCIGSLLVLIDGQEMAFRDCYVLDYEHGDLVILTRDNVRRTIPVKDVYSCEYYLRREFY